MKSYKGGCLDREINHAAVLLVFRELFTDEAAKGKNYLSLERIEDFHAFLPPLDEVRTCEDSQMLRDAGLAGL